ncbi:related to metallophosphoesterase domain-containing protein 2 [Rhynchosporium agropyri]|uniref:Related to metallophosphoesterase domain-containing protein 2 n=1 Tax=Rhynchosporium agropyri TaxID=914238 RepID=A0A1E1K4Z7_9HELO|nr:related to metallophosphoesterase domain-containing protein 2 [Rhynchosporium agropyri]
MSPTSTRFLVISDTHNFEFKEETGPFRAPAPKVDVVLHCGDLTQVGGISEYKRSLRMLGQIEAELKLVIAGNHDLSLDPEYWQTLEEDEQDSEREEHLEAMQIMTGKLAMDAGVTYLEEGTHTFKLQNGAKFRIYASPYQPKFGDWAFPYERNEDRYNLAGQSAPGTTSISRNPIPSFPSIAIMMTHGPPRGILDECVDGHIGCDNLLRAVKRARPKMYCFGHIHEGYGAKLVTWRETESGSTRANNGKPQVNKYPISSSSKVGIDFGTETLMVNAAIMNEKNQPANDPWIFDLDLESDRDLSN